MIWKNQTMRAKQNSTKRPNFANANMSFQMPLNHHQQTGIA